MFVTLDTRQARGRARLVHWPLPPDPEEGDSEALIALSVATIGRDLQRLARRIAKGDGDLADEMYQEAMIRLWELDPARFGEDDERFLFRALLNRMLDVRREAEGDAA